MGWLALTPPYAKQNLVPLNPKFLYGHFLDLQYKLYNIAWTRRSLPHLINLVISWTLLHVDWTPMDRYYVRWTDIMTDGHTYNSVIQKEFIVDTYVLHCGPQNQIYKNQFNTISIQLHRIYIYSTTIPHRTTRLTVQSKALL